MRTGVNTLRPRSFDPVRKHDEVFPDHSGLYSIMESFRRDRLGKALAAALSLSVASGCTLKYKGDSAVETPRGCTSQLDVAGLETPMTEINYIQTAETCPIEVRKKERRRELRRMATNGIIGDEALAMAIQAADARAEAEFAGEKGEDTEITGRQLHTGPGLAPFFMNKVETTVTTLGAAAIGGHYLEGAYESLDADRSSIRLENDSTSISSAEAQALSKLHAKIVNDPKIDLKTRVGVSQMNMQKFKDWCTKYNKCL